MIAGAHATGWRQDAAMPPVEQGTGRNP